MSSMRGIDTPVRQRRRRVFKEVANLAYNSKNLKDDMEALPYKIVDYEESEFWESVYRDRAIIRERIRLAMGMSLRPENREHPGHLTQGLEESNIDEKYYELTLEQRKNKMKMLAMANTLNKKMEIVDNCSCDNINGKFIIKDEFTYILSLLICGNIVLLEKKESNVFIKYTNVPESKDNYIIVNKFAKDILKSYLKEQRGE
mgnify:CR=1 FL=1